MRGEWEIERDEAGGDKKRNVRNRERKGADGRERAGDRIEIQ